MANALCIFLLVATGAASVGFFFWRWSAGKTISQRSSKRAFTVGFMLLLGFPMASTMYSPVIHELVDIMAILGGLGSAVFGTLGLAKPLIDLIFRGDLPK